jgi:hypothetical protein
MSLARWRWVLGLRDPQSPMTRSDLREALKALPELPEAERMRHRTVTPRKPRSLVEWHQQHGKRRSA